MAVEWNSQGTRRRPRMTWMRSTHVEYQDRYSWQEVRTMTQDRPRWAELVFALCSKCDIFHYFNFLTLFIYIFFYCLFL